MATETEWRRRWKPSLAACPWQSVDVDGENLLIKMKFSDKSYEVLITDLTSFWYESLEEKDLKKRIEKLNPSIEAPVTKFLDQIQQNLEKPGQQTKLSVNFKKSESGAGQKMVFKITSILAGMPFVWNFHADPADDSMARDHLTIPLLAMVSELFRRQQELFKIIAAKDKEIDDYKSQGVRTSRKHIETAKFDGIAFKNSMVTSKGFEEQVKKLETATFDSEGQELYRQIVTKNAWLTHKAGGVTTTGRNKAAYRRYSQENLEQALAAVKTQQRSIGAAAKQFGIPKSTLKGYVSGKSTLGRKAGRRPSLPSEIENELVDRVIEAARQGSPVTKKQLLRKVGNLAETLHLKTQFKCNHPSDEYWRSLKKRRPELTIHKKLGILPANKSKLSPEASAPSITEQPPETVGAVDEIEELVKEAAAQATTRGTLVADEDVPSQPQTDDVATLPITVQDVQGLQGVTIEVQGGEPIHLDVIGVGADLPVTVATTQTNTESKSQVDDSFGMKTPLQPPPPQPLTVQESSSSIATHRLMTSDESKIAQQEEKEGAKRRRTKIAEDGNRQKRTKLKQ